MTVGLADFTTSGTFAVTVNSYFFVSPFFQVSCESVPRRSEYDSPQRQLSCMAMPTSSSDRNVSMHPSPPSDTEISCPFSLMT